jgi:hypothetical protein
MATDRFLIAPLNSGMQTDLRPWLVPDDAFETLNNAYVFRGRLRKRFGSQWMGSTQLSSRLRIQLETTDMSGNVSTFIPRTGNVPYVQGAIGQMFSIGTELFTVNDLGTPVALLHTGSSTLAKFDTSTGNATSGQLIINGAAALTPVFFYPALPVMGLTQYEDAPVNSYVSYAFDTRFAYSFAGGFWQQSQTGGDPVFHGDNTNFFWATNWRGNPNEVYLFVSNFQVTNYNDAIAATDDPIWTFNTTAGWAPFEPTFLTAGNFVKTARIILPFKRRLVLLSTVEVSADGTTNSTFYQRCRFSQVGSPFGANAWLEQSQVGSAGAGFIDAATEEEIVSAEYIKDRLIVYFEQSTWELAYTGNENEPFNWQKINTELGCEATFSIVPFDKIVLGIGDTGIHACSGANVERIDNKIPDQIFDFGANPSQVARIAGIRDYYTETVYWTFPSANEVPSETYPNRILIYNYKNGSWAFNDDCVTTWGYFDQETGVTWASSTDTWEEAEFTWESGEIDTNFRQVIAGNQEGFVFIVDPDEGRNAAVMQITQIAQFTDYAQLTIIDHTLRVGDFVTVESAQGVTLTNGPIYKVISVLLGSNDVLVGTFDLITGNPIPLIVTGTYTGGGVSARVSNINFLSKQWNPYVKDGYNLYLAKIDFGVKKTSSGAITIDYYPSATELSMIDQGGPTGTNCLTGNNVLETFPYNPAIYPLEQSQERLWHPIYFQSDGECIQLSVYMSDMQMLNPSIAWSDFQLEGLILHTMKTSSRLL